MEKTFNFIINDKGIPIFQGYFNKYMQENKMKKGFMRIFLYDPRDNNSIAGYYKGYLIPRLRLAYQENHSRIYREKEIEHIIWTDLGLYDRYDTDEPDVYKLEVQDIWLICEEIKQFASINLKYYIE